MTVEPDSAGPVHRTGRDQRHKCVFFFWGGVADLERTGIERFLLGLHKELVKDSAKEPENSPHRADEVYLDVVHRRESNPNAGHKKCQLEAIVQHDSKDQLLHEELLSQGTGSQMKSDSNAPAGRLCMATLGLS